MMASADWKKLKGAADVAAMVGHNDKQTRLEHEHANQDIDKNLTVTNLQYKNSSYQQTMDKYHRILDKLDSGSNTNKRKDRVTAISLYVPIVPGIVDKDRVEYANTVIDAIESVLGKELILNAYWHFDEKHEYLDPITEEKKMSLDHGHVLLMPIVDGKLNAKAFSSRANMIKVNNAIQKAVYDKFGVYFMDGSGKKIKGTVEDLKQASKKAELKQREARVKDREKSVKAKEIAVTKRETAVKSRETAVESREKAVGVAEAHLKETQGLYDDMLDEITQMKSQLTPKAVEQVNTLINNHKNRRKTLEEKYKGTITDTEYMEAKTNDNFSKFFPSDPSML